MTKITLDRETFKALASDTRLDILKTLDGKNMGLNEIAKVSNLNKATLHEHLAKLHEVGLIKRSERDGHKWVYYKLTWKGESLLHPENTKIVILFTTTFVALWVGIIQLIWYIKGTVTIGDQAVLSGKGLVDNGNFLQAGNGWTEGLSVPPGLPDFFQTFLMRAKIAYMQGVPLGKEFTVMQDASDSGSLTAGDGGRFVVDQSQGVIQAVYQNPMYLYIALGCFVLFAVVLCVALWRLWENRTPKI
ncbi:MAG: winged helix-turn-helix transcriptional regulator [Thermoplasmata archaeon]|nr:winged helix-turn-helix transcriptional regulator [Thermoplasmata archaeon]